VSTPRPQAIIADLVARLKAATTAAGDNVLPNRMLDLDEEDPPAILVFVKQSEQTADALLGAPRSYQRALELGITALLPDQAGLDDALYLIADQIETVVHDDETHGGNADQTVWEKTKWDWDPEGNQVVGRAEMSFTVIYRDL
jgi:hypothetical protein